MRFSILLIGTIFFSSFSCIREHAQPANEPVASVNGKYLYKKDLKNLFIQKVPVQDSIIIAQSYIDSWIKEQLILAKAEMNLSEEDKDVSKKLENYRNSLLIYKYQENYIKQNLDTIISDDEIKEYYENNTQNFISGNNLVKAKYIKISDKLPYNDISHVRQWLLSSKNDHEEELYDYCLQYAEKFDDFNKDWVIFDMIQIQFPKKIYNPEVNLKFNKYYETRDTSYFYFLKIDDFVAKSNVAPIEYIEGKVKSIIINKRKITLIKKLESEVYNDAMNRDLVQKY